jgi:hypothetical protein
MEILYCGKFVGFKIMKSGFIPNKDKTGVLYQRPFQGSQVQTERP